MGYTVNWDDSMTKYPDCKANLSNTRQIDIIFSNLGGKYNVDTLISTVWTDFESWTSGYCEQLINDIRSSRSTIPESTMLAGCITALKKQYNHFDDSMRSSDEVESALKNYRISLTVHIPASAAEDMREEAKNKVILAVQKFIEPHLSDVAAYFKNLDDIHIREPYRDKPLADYSSNPTTNSDTSSGGGENPISEKDKETGTAEITSTDESGLYTNAEFKMLNSSYVQRKVESDITRSKIDNLRHVFGIPYQFLPETDRRYGEYKSDPDAQLQSDLSIFDDTSYMGHTYIERIAQRANILYITPGSPKFLKGATKETKEKLLRTMLGLTDGSLKSAEAMAFMEDEGSLRYYSFDEDLEGFYEYLNPMLRAAARYLGLHDERVSAEDATLDKFHFSEYIGAPMTEGYNAYGALTFYVDGLNNSSDSIGNTVSPSSFVDQFDQQITSTAQEIWTIAGKGLNDLTGSELANSVSGMEGAQQAMHDIDNFVNKFLGGNTFLKNLSVGGSVMAVGGHIIFPEIWRDSDFRGETFTLNFKFVSPDNDDESIFWNCLVPMMAWICLAAPRGYDNIDGFGPPFCVRAFCQSMFHIEMGYVTGLQISKGGEGMWTASGLPTSIEISVQIKDLYDNIYISSGSKDYNFSWWNIAQNVGEITRKTPFLKNTAMLNWIANSCGVNINKPDILRDIDMYFTHVYVNPILDIIPNYSLMLYDTVRNWSTSLFNVLSRIIK